MTATAFLFPGQGAQRPGMGRDLTADRPDLRERYYRAADDLLGFPLSAACFEGTDELLRRTEITQPAIFLTSVVTLDLIAETLPAPAIVAGHSLGEYAALVCAGALEWTDALHLVARRGALMAAVNKRRPGRMAALFGTTPAAVEQLCAATPGVVEIANDNSTDQLVISGEADAVETVAAAARAGGAERVVMLEVGAPFHCSLMHDIEQEFAARLDRVTIRDPKIPVIANATGSYVTDAEGVATALRAQLAGRVRWTDTMRLLAVSGVQQAAEVGPGRVLAGLARATNPGLTVHSTNDTRRLRQTLAALSPSGQALVA